MNPTPEQIAWLAGLFEGEGCAEIRILKNGFGPYPALNIQMTDHDVLKTVHEIFGGKLYGPYATGQPRSDGSPRKPQYKWTVAKGNDVLVLAKLIRPWMHGRRGERLDEIITLLERKAA